MEQLLLEGMHHGRQVFPAARTEKEEDCMKSLFESHVNLLGKVMDMQLQRQNVVMSNVANLKTPGYKARNLEFEDE